MLPTTMTFRLGRNAEYGHIDVNLEQLPANAKDFIFEYGLRQILNDAIATKVDKDGNDLTVGEIHNKALARLGNLYEGIISRRGMDGGEPADPYEAEAFKEAKKFLMAGLIKAGAMRDIPKGTKDRLMYVLNGLRAKAGKPEMTEHEYLTMWLGTPKGKEIAAIAHRTVSERKAMGADLDDLLGLDDEETA